MSRLYSARIEDSSFEGMLANKTLAIQDNTACLNGVKPVRIIFSPKHDDIINLFSSSGRNESAESCILDQIRMNAIWHYLVPMSKQFEDTDTKFHMLKKNWEIETSMLSSITARAMHPAYQQIIGMGQKVVPLILAEMTMKPGLWFWALKSITGADPVRAEDRGHIKRMTAAWMAWGKKHGYI